LDDELCLKHLPKLFGTALNFFQSEHHEVVHAAANTMKVSLITFALNPIIPGLFQTFVPRGAFFARGP